MLNEVVLPTAKRETSAQFRETSMKDEGITKVGCNTMYRGGCKTMYLGCDACIVRLQPMC